MDSQSRSQLKSSMWDYGSQSEQKPERKAGLFIGSIYGTLKKQNETENQDELKDEQLGAHSKTEQKKSDDNFNMFSSQRKSNEPRYVTWRSSNQRTRQVRLRSTKVQRSAEELFLNKIANQNKVQPLRYTFHKDGESQDGNAGADAGGQLNLTVDGIRPGDGGKLGLADQSERSDQQSDSRYTSQKSASDEFFDCPGINEQNFGDAADRVEGQDLNQKKDDADRNEQENLKSELEVYLQRKKQEEEKAMQDNQAKIQFVQDQISQAQILLKSAENRVQLIDEGRVEPVNIEQIKIENQENQKIETETEQKQEEIMKIEDQEEENQNQSDKVCDDGNDDFKIKNEKEITPDYDQYQTKIRKQSEEKVDISQSPAQQIIVTPKNSMKMFANSNFKQTKSDWMRANLGRVNDYLNQKKKVEEVSKKIDSEQPVQPALAGRLKQTTTPDGDVDTPGGMYAFGTREPRRGIESKLNKMHNYALGSEYRRLYYSLKQRRKSIDHGRFIKWQPVHIFCGLDLIKQEERKRAFSVGLKEERRYFEVRERGNIQQILKKQRTRFDQVKDFTQKIDVNLRLKAAIMDLVQTNESKNANNSACKDLRDFFKELKGMKTNQILQILTSNIMPGKPHDKLHGFPNLIREVHTCCDLICEQFATLQAQQLKVWDYENMQKRCVDYQRLVKENQMLKDNMIKFHQSDLLKMESLQSIRSQLEVMRNDNYILEEQNEQLEMRIKSVQEQYDSLIFKENVERNLKEKMNGENHTAMKLGHTDAKSSILETSDNQNSKLQKQSNEINFVERLDYKTTGGHQTPNYESLIGEFSVTDEEETILSGLHHYLYLKQEFKDAVRKYIFKTVSRLRQLQAYQALYYARECKRLNQKVQRIQEQKDQLERELQGNFGTLAKMEMMMRGKEFDIKATKSQFLQWREENDYLRYFVIENFENMIKFKKFIDESLQDKTIDVQSAIVSGSKHGGVDRQVVIEDASHGGQGGTSGPDGDGATVTAGNQDNGATSQKESDDEEDDYDKIDLNQLTNQYLIDKYQKLAKNILKNNEQFSMQKVKQPQIEFKKVNMSVLTKNSSFIESLRQQINLSVDGHTPEICTSLHKELPKSQEMEFQDARLRPIYQKGVDTSNTVMTELYNETNSFMDLNESKNYSEENFGEHVTEEFEALKQFKIDQKYSKDYDQIGLTYIQHMYFKSFEFLIEESEQYRKTILKKRNQILASTQSKIKVTIDNEKVEKNADNLFYSDNAKLYQDKQMRRCILVIHHGLVYFTCKDDKLLSQNPMEEILLKTKTPGQAEDRKRQMVGKMLLLPAIDISEDVKRIILPKQSQNNKYQLAFHLNAYKKPDSADSLGSKQMISLRQQRDHVIFEVESGRKQLVKFLKAYMARQEEELDIVQKEEFQMVVRDLKIHFKFNELQTYEEANPQGKIGAGKQIEGFIEIKDNNKPKEGIRCGKGMFSGFKGGQNKFWHYQYVILNGTQLQIFDVQRISVTKTLKVQTKTIQVTDRSFVKEVRLDRDKTGVCDGKRFVMNFITVHPPEADDEMVKAKKRKMSPKKQKTLNLQKGGQAPTGEPIELEKQDSGLTTDDGHGGQQNEIDNKNMENELDILIHCQNQQEYDALYQAFSKIRKQYDASKFVFIKDVEYQQDYLRSLKEMK